MCGFCLAVDDDSVDIRGLTDSIKHRGPDSTRYYVGERVRCGFNRLAIVDDDRRSDQPMIDASGRYLLLFNGEIYNHNALRAWLEARHGVKTVTRSDTEVLLAGLIHEGVPFVSRLDGIFALAFVDLARVEVTVARDPFGVKPLYYHVRGESLYVCSEVRPLWELAGRTLSRGNIARFLAYGTVDRGETIVEGVRALEPNTVRVFRGGQESAPSRIEEFAFGTREGVDSEELGEVLYGAIEGQKPAIAYGVLFSGGLDSTLILERCAADGELAGVYSADIVHPEMSEKKWQTYVIDKLALGERHRRVELRSEHLAVESMAAMSSGLDYPLYHPNFVASLLLTKEAANDGLKVLISGEGADELFLGYRWFFATPPAAEFLEYVPLRDMQNLLRVSEEPPVETNGMTLLEIFQKIYLQRWLLRQDLTGMANSVEVRVPFLDLEVARLANSLSYEFKWGTGESKWLLKALLAKHFSPEFVGRKKMGFDFPLNTWIGAEHLDAVRKESDLIEAAALSDVMTKYEGSYMQKRILFALVALSVWCQGLARS